MKNSSKREKRREKVMTPTREASREEARRTRKVNKKKSFQEETVAALRLTRRPPPRLMRRPPEADAEAPRGRPAEKLCAAARAVGEAATSRRRATSGRHLGRLEEGAGLVRHAQERQGSGRRRKRSYSLKHSKAVADVLKAPELKVNLSVIH